jgi:hypothetical protein
MAIWRQSMTNKIRYSSTEIQDILISVDYLRKANTENEFEQLSLSVKELRELREEAVYYNLNGMIDLIDNEITKTCCLDGFVKQNTKRFFDRFRQIICNQKIFFKFCFNWNRNFLLLFLLSEKYSVGPESVRKLNTKIL